tara:strand:- start:54 stop:497 length:444 start_codon:yes stop_codon:yes gene_type:complete
MIVCSGIKSASDEVYPRLRFSTDNASSYLSDYQEVRHGRVSDGNQTNSNATTTSSMSLIGGSGLGNSTGELFNSVITIFDPLKQSGTTDARTIFTAQTGYLMNSGYSTIVNVCSANKTNTAVNNILFEMSSGNITSGKVSLYGRKLS